MKENKENRAHELNLSKYRHHKRTVPRGLIRKIIVAAVLIGLLIYLRSIIEEKNNETVELPAEVEL